MSSAGVGLQGNPFGTGSNQWGAGWPQLNMPSSSYYGTNAGYGGFYPGSPGGGPSVIPGLNPAGYGYYAGSTYDPGLTSNFMGYLNSQVGQQSPLYGGQLTAGPNDILTQIANMLTGKQSTLPGASQMQSMAQTGNPIDQTGAWQAMLAAQQQNIAQNQAGLKEQLSAGGNLVGTPYGNTMANYQEQTAAQQNALLGQMQTSALESAANRELAAQQGLTGLGLQTSGQLQGINQLGLSNAYNEWLRTQPQYSPLLSYMNATSTTFPPYLNQQSQASPFAYALPALINLLGNKTPSMGTSQLLGGLGLPNVGGLGGAPGGGGAGGEYGATGTSISYDSSGNPVLIDPSTGQPVNEANSIYQSSLGAPTDPSGMQLPTNIPYNDLGTYFNFGGIGGGGGSDFTGGGGGDFGGMSLF